MNAKLSILFYAKRAKTTADGLLPIYIRVTVDGERIELSTKRYTSPDKWSVEGNRMKGTSAEAKAVNAYLDALKAKVYEYQQQLIREDEEVNAENMRNKILGIEKRKHMLVAIFKQHNDEIKALIGKDYAPATHIRYETSLKHTVHYLQWKYKISDIDIRKIDHEFITGYEFYLKSVCKCCQNTTSKYIKNFGKIIRICLANGWIERNPFINYKSKIIEVERVFLSIEEIEILLNKEFAMERLNQVKDIFLFSCFTGLAYADVKKLSPRNIGLGIDGERWIFINRTKTDTRSNIPILPIAATILEKYRNHPQVVMKGKLLPVLSNQKMNAYLKEIADLCGFNKELTFHIARHTFATTVTLSNGVPIESVSKMLGHKNLKTTQHYAKILDLKVSNDMQVLKAKFENKKLTDNHKKIG
jgi:site-specific recombinase XerD